MKREIQAGLIANRQRVESAKATVPKTAQTIPEDDKIADEVIEEDVIGDEEVPEMDESIHEETMHKPEDDFKLDQDDWFSQHLP